VRLTKTAKRAGCAAKQPPGFLFPLLTKLPAIVDPNVLVGSASADDAAVIRVSDDLAIVTTTDFFTPIVDDPGDFGRIAAANALSDIYAMGAKPLTALNLVGFPSDVLEAQVLAEILAGAYEIAREAGIDIVGGHTIQTDEPIFGLAVTGTVHPHQVVTNAGGRPGDRLILTKPIGLGIVTTAAKQDRDEEGAITEAIAVMTTLNAGACRAMLAVGVHAATDVTGFGLLGHLRNLAKASGVSARVYTSAVPVLDAARRYVALGLAPGGTHANWRFLQAYVRFDVDVSKNEQLLLCDAQTSGGLLLAVPPHLEQDLLAVLRAEGTLAAAVVGELVIGEPGAIVVVALASQRQPLKSETPALRAESGRLFTASAIEVR